MLYEVITPLARHAVGDERRKLELLQIATDLAPASRVAHQGSGPNHTVSNFWSLSASRKPATAWLTLAQLGRLWLVITSYSIHYTKLYEGIPVSTTHAITGTIMGAGAARRKRAVRWKVGKQIVIAWIITIPGSAGLGMLATYIIDLV